MLSYSALKKEVDSLRSELRKVRAQSAQKDPGAATRGDIENLAKTIREVDRKRSADKELILKEMKSCRSLIIECFQFLCRKFICELRILRINNFAALQDSQT